ncbi:MAG: cyclomaltodextrinase C-terminal domain-containing protein, partial [Chitinophagaceae bacterium]|nr:cyclomaltodextrinase C-terminal domain-containing protein [Chitinophagaceae bacterium]
FRYAPGDTLMVVMNRNEKEMMLDTRRFSEIISQQSTAIPTFGSEPIPLNTALRIAPKTAMVFEIRQGKVENIRRN